MTLFASDFALGSGPSTLSMPHHHQPRSPITPIDVVFTTTSSPSLSNQHSDHDDSGASPRFVVAPTGRRMSKVMPPKPPPGPTRTASNMSSQTITQQSHSFSRRSPQTGYALNSPSSPPPSYERSHGRKQHTQPPPPLDFQSPKDTSNGFADTTPSTRSRSTYFPTSPGAASSARRASAQVGASGVEGGGGGGRRMSSVGVGRERRGSVDEIKQTEKRKEDSQRHATSSSSAAGPGTIGFESCISGALAHEKKARSYGETASTKALHHFTRANDLLALALKERPDELEALAYKANITHVLATHYHTPVHALESVRTLVKSLRSALVQAAVTGPVHQTVAAQTQLASLTHLLATLTESLHLSLLPRAIWAGETGELVRESVKTWQAVMASERATMLEGTVPVVGAEWLEGLSGDEEEMHKHRLRRSSSVVNRIVTHATLVEGYLAMADAAKYAAGLAVDLLTADQYFDIAEDAIECALKMAAMVQVGPPQASPRVLHEIPAFKVQVTSATGSPSSDFVAATVLSPEVQKVRLRSGPLKIERLRQTNALAPQLPINHVQGRAIITEMKALTSELNMLVAEPPVVVSSTVRAGHKMMYIRSVTDLGHAQFVLAQLLKRTWRKRGGLKVPGRKGSAVSFDQTRKLSTASTSSSISDAGSIGSAATSPSAVPRRLSGGDSRKGSVISRQGSFTIVEDPNEEDEDADEASDEIEASNTSAVRKMSLSFVGTGFGSGRSSVSSSISPPTSPRRGSTIPNSSLRKASVPPSLGGPSYNPSPLSSADQAAGTTTSTGEVVFSSPFGTPPSHSTLMQQHPRSTSYESPSSQRRPSHAPMSMAAYRRASAAGAALGPGQDESSGADPAAGPAAGGWAQRKASVAPSGGILVHPSNASSGMSTDALPLSPTTAGTPTYSSSELANQAWDLLSSSIKNHKIALSLLHSPTTTTTSTTQPNPFPSSQTSLPYQRASLLLAISASSYFRASLASRVPRAQESRTSLLVTAEVYATWSARELGWDWLVESSPCPSPSSYHSAQEVAQANLPSSPHRGLLSPSAALGLRALFTLMRTIWHKAVTGIPGEVHAQEKRLAKERVERMTGRLRREVGVGGYEVTRFKVGLERVEGEFEVGEGLFWGNVSRGVKEKEREKDEK